jgi:glycosyltransferase involved in cell wall biosynthesis
MRLLYLTDRLSHRGGAQHHLLDIITAMAQRHDITVAAAAFDKDVCLPAGVSTVRLKGLRATIATQRGLHGLDALLADADGVHIQNVMNPEALAAATGPNTVVTIQDHRVFCPGPGKTLPSGNPCTVPMSDTVCETCCPDTTHRERMIALTSARLDTLHAAAQVLVLSQYMAECLAQVGIDSVTVLPPPVPPGPPKSSPGHGFLVAGRLVHHKGTDQAIAAWRAAESDHPLSLAGLGSETAGIEDALKLGWLDRDLLRTTMAEARALIFPSRWAEPFGIVGAEALAMGTPVVAMVAGGMSDWTHTGTLAIAPGDIAGMTAAIRTLAADPELALTLGAAGQAWTTAHLAPAPLHDRLEAIYRALI